MIRYVAIQRNFKAGEKVEFRFPEESWSILKEVKPRISEDVSVFKSTIGKPRTPLSKTFAEQKVIPSTRLKTITKETYVPSMVAPSTAMKQAKGIISKVSKGQLTRTIPPTTTTMASISKQMSEQQRDYGMVPKPYSSLTQISIPTLKESLVSGTTLKLGQTQLQKQITSPALITPPSMVAPSISPQFRMPFIPLLPPVGMRLGTGIKWKGLQLEKQPTKYQPSFSALVLGIKAPKIPAAYKAGAGGLIIRPIITKKKTKRRKKK